MESKFGSGKNLLYRYLPPARFAKRIGFPHPDPLIDEFTYGEGGRYSDFVKRSLSIGNYVFFHTTIGGVRSITAYYVVSDIKEGHNARRDKGLRAKYRNPHLRSRFAGDVLIFGDPTKSRDLRSNPLPFDRNLAQKLQFGTGRRIRFDVKDKNGTPRSDATCITSATRRPRVLTDDDVELLLREIGKHDSK